MKKRTVMDGFDLTYKSPGCDKKISKFLSYWSGCKLSAFMFDSRTGQVTAWIGFNFSFDIVPEMLRVFRPRWFDRVVVKEYETSDRFLTLFRGTDILMDMRKKNEAGFRVSKVSNTPPITES